MPKNDRKIEVVGLYRVCVSGSNMMSQKYFRIFLTNRLPLTCIPVKNDYYEVIIQDIVTQICSRCIIQRLYTELKVCSHFSCSLTNWTQELKRRRHFYY